MTQRLPVSRKMPLAFVLSALLILASAVQAQVATTFSTAGTFSYAVPAGVNKVVVECWGGGGRGGARTSNGQAGGAGGGAYSRAVVNVTPLTNQSVTVGVGSNSGTSPGGDSFFISNTTVMAKGGGSVADNATTGAAGGSAASSVGTVKFSGAAGATIGSSIGGGGGSSAGIAAAGNASIGLGVGGTAPTGGGDGGGGGGLFGGVGTAGVAPGGGGGGASKTFFTGGTQAGGAGGAGKVIVTYYNNGTCISTTNGFNSIIDNGCATALTTSIPVHITGQPTTLGTAAGNAKLFSVQLIVAHTFNQDMQITLTTPGGVTRNMVTSRFGSGDNLGNPGTCPTTLFTLQDGGLALNNTNTSNVGGTFAPENTLVGFTGDPNGSWLLNICDGAGTDVGRVVYVKLNFCTVPQITASSSNSPICAGSTLTLSASATGSPTPTYSWAGTGTYSPNNTSANPSVTGAATGTYVVTASSSCGSTTANVPVVVNPRPTATLAGNGPVCNPGAPQLTGTLSGTGPWSITYTTNGGSPATVSGIAASPYTINPAGPISSATTYAITAISDANCAATVFPASVNIGVIPRPTATLVGNGPFCASGSPQLTGTLTATGPWSITYTTNGGSPLTVSGIAASPYTINPAGPITSTTTYAITAISDATCSATVFPAAVNVVVNPRPTATLNANGPLCDSGSPQLTGNLTGTGPWSVTYTTNGGSPATVSGIAASPYTINPTGPISGTTTYAITAISDANCAATSFPASVNVVVNPLPTVNCGTYGPACVDAADILLGGSPGGGTWSGTGVTGNNFDPSAGTQLVTYTYTDGNSCTNSCSTTITVNPLPVVTCPANSSVCIDALAYSLNGSGENPAGGTFSGPGVSGNSFDPGAAGAGTHTIMYCYADGNGCDDCCNYTITVNALPVLSCGSYGPVCVTDPDVLLAGSPSGGTWSGTGVTGSNFDPSAGTQLLTYTYTDGNSCTNSCQTTITVVNTCNDLCTNAIALSCNSVVSGSTLGTTPDAVPTCGGTTLNTAGGVWYTVVGTGGNITASLCGSSYDSGIGVFTTPNCTAFTCVAGNNNFCALNGQVTFLSTLGQTYYILVTGFGTATGAYTLEVVCNGDGNCNNNGVVVNIHTDNNGNETSWEIVPVGNSVPVCSGSGYGNNATINVSCCLLDGCYVLTFFDSFNDGMCCLNGTGGYVLKTATGKRIVDNMDDGTFTGESSLANGFCLPIGATQLTVATCDKVDFLINDVVVSGIDPAVSAEYGVTDATSGYQFWLFDPDGGYSRRLFRSHASGSCLATPVGPTRAAHMKFSCLNSVLPNVPMDVLLNMRVRPRVAGVYGEFGPTCRVMVLSVPNTCPTTKLDDNPLHAGTTLSCGVSGKVVGGSGNGSKLFPNIVAGANKYQYEFSYPAESYLRTIATPTGSYALVLTNWATSPLICGTVTYDVRVRVSFDGGATYCPYGPVCTVGITNNPPNNCTTTVQGGGNQNSARVEEKGISLWPNPAREGNVTLDLNGLSNEATTATVDIFDMFGKKVMTTVLATDGAEQMNTVLELEDLATGMYTVNVISGKQSFTDRLVIE
ncbi:MAG: T9SS type A sorting domain-containing protein [Flavobacteriales bacterium]